MQADKMLQTWKSFVAIIVLTMYKFDIPPTQKAIN